MKTIRFFLTLLIFQLILTCGLLTGVQAADLLPSWNDGGVKQTIVEFVTKVTNADSPDFVPPAERIAVFDNDGTLWVEQPMYTQLAFTADRIRELAVQNPDWKSTQPFQAVLEKDMAALADSGKKGLMTMLMAAHAGMTTEEFQKIVTDWFARARHPRFLKPYIELAYQPMLELLEYLRKNGFKTYIVSGGGIEFMRPMTENVYGIPPEQVVGSSIKTKYELRDGQPVLVRQPEIFFIDDKEGKPVGINAFIGRRPILAFGNSDGDYQMLQWTTTAPGKRLGLILHHTDGKREYAYDRQSHFGKLDRGLDDAEKNGWIVVDMAKDWKEVFAFEQ
jgi:phosphoglycolate phosphatase-like HAD superfamily hydrolase